MRKKLPTIILILAFVVGLSLLLYPTFSNYWNSLHQTRAIAEYAESVADLNAEEYDAMLEAARAYNQKLYEGGAHWTLTEEEQAEYESLLSTGITGVMGYVSIPSINVTLPIYHGTDDSVLQKGAGHLEGSSLPVGGEGTHAVLSGHRGLPSAKLFTDLDKLAEGDTFILKILDEILTYEVDQILIVEPYELGALAIEEGKDYCTLVTCTPYGINTHRLLVRGHRIENEEEAKTIRVTADALQIEPVIVAPAVAAPMLLILLIVLLVTTKKKKR